jgi:CRP/FNR family transcriptional regulator, cyclic AMP receptor protein
MMVGGGQTASGERISAIAACFACSDETALLLADAMTERCYARRTHIARHGDKAAMLYLVVEGQVVAEIFGLEGQQAQLARHGPGEIFGAYPAPASHRADIVATSDARLLSIGTLELAALAAAHAEIGVGLSRLFARQLDLLLDRMAARIGLSATGRFHKALLELSDVDGTISPPPVISALALSVHTTRETGSRALATLLRRGIVERKGDALRVVSRRMLEDMIV